LPSGAVYSQPVNVTAGLTTQVTLLASGNPLNFAIVNGPSGASVHPTLGVLTYTPALGVSGAVAIKVKIYNALGSVTQTVPFNVTAPDTNLLKPTLKITGKLLTYNGQPQGVSAHAIASDGIKHIAGTFTFAYNGSQGAPTNVGKYGVLATFTSSNPRYANATLLGRVTIGKTTPAFAELSSQTIAVGTPSITVAGSIANGLAIPTGDSVEVTLKGATQAAVVDANGNFSAVLTTHKRKVGKYIISYTFAGDANFNAASATSRLRVIPTAAPMVTVNPSGVTTTVGDGASFTAAATGSPPPEVQWQVSTDGGKTFADLFSPGGDTLVFTAAINQNGNQYRAVFSNTVGTSISSAAVLIVQADSGEGG
jgi:hypothetical protein